MANAVTITGDGRVSATMRAKRKQQPDWIEYSVSYEAPYALLIHENLQMSLRGEPRPSGRGKYWDARNRPGSSKYLEIPLRKMQGAGGKSMILALMRSGLSLVQATYHTAKVLLLESRKLVPYEFGKLWRSGRVRRLRQVGGPTGPSGDGGGSGGFGPLPTFDTRGALEGMANKQNRFM